MGVTGGWRWVKTQLARLGDLVCREHHQRLLVGVCRLVAQRGLALRIWGDALILTDSNHKAGDSGAEALA